MPIWTTHRSSANITLGHVPRTRVTTIKVKANGLMPRSSYTFWCNGTDMTWACRTLGSRMGAGLISDQYGTLEVLFSAELTDEYAPASADSTKYSTMQLKDVNGNIHSFSLAQQTLIGK